MKDKLTLEEMSDRLVLTTLNATLTYVEEYKMDVPKIMWTWLHIGYYHAMITCGYKKEFVEKAVELAQIKLDKIAPEKK